MDGIDHKGAKIIALVRQCAGEGREILAIVRGNSAAYILKNNQSGRAPLLGEVFHETPKRPECAGPGAPQTRAVASQRKVLAREGSPSKIGCAGQIVCREAAHVLDLEPLATPVLLVCGP